MKKPFLITIILFMLVTSAGCVRRIVTMDSQPQGAQVYFDRKLVGETPCEFEFLYYGGHHLELFKEGYENYTTTLKLKGPLYEYFPFSIFSELLIPWQLTDKHDHTFKLEKGQARKPVISPIEQPQPSLPAPRFQRIGQRQQ